MQPGLPFGDASRRESLDAWLSTPGARAHGIGIGGIGMAGVARLLAAAGQCVTGCDASPGRTADWLARHGIPVATGHDPAHLSDADWAFYSPAVPDSHPERAAAIPQYRRGEVLAALAARRRTVAVAGTHGKTTTSALIAHLLRASGIPAGFCVGGETAPDGAPAAPGTAPELVVEADESDGTLALYAPAVAVVTNIEFDHADHFASFNAFRDCFRTFASRAGHLVACADDPETAALAAGMNHASLAPPPGGLPAQGRGGEFPRVTTYGLSPDLPWHPSGLVPDSSGWTFRIHAPDGASVPIRLPLPGRHNVLNALAAFAACRALPNPPSLDALGAALADFRLPRRRLDLFPTARGVTLVGDYAHHPTEIRALVDAVRQLAPPDTRLLAAFQPHRYSRTLLLKHAFPAAFDGIAAGVLLPVYAASEPPLPGGTSEDLLDAFRNARPGAPWQLVPSLDAAAGVLSALARPGDWLLVVGAGSIEALLPLLQDAFGSP